MTIIVVYSGGAAPRKLFAKHMTGKNPDPVERQISKMILADGDDADRKEANRFLACIPDIPMRKRTRKHLKDMAALMVDINWLEIVKVARLLMNNPAGIGEAEIYAEIGAPNIPADMAE